MYNQCLRSIMVLLLAVLFVNSSNAQTSEFTYQGSLRDGANAANGSYDFEFALFGALSGGTQLGSTIAVNSVAVVNGVFSVKLDFGREFPGADRYLEIRVRPSGQSGITILAPRQTVSSSPYALQSFSAEAATTATTAANSNQLGGVEANQFVLTGDSRLTNARPPTPGSSNYVQNGTTQQTASNFNISGNGVIGGNLGVGTSGPFLAKIQTVRTGTGPAVLGISNSIANLPTIQNLSMGVGGSSVDNIGVYGESTNNTGVYGYSDQGTAVYGFSMTGWAGSFDGKSNFGGPVYLGDLVKVFVLGSAGSTSLCRNASNEIATCSSSLRYKTNINRFGFGLSLINQLKPITFDWKDGGMHDLGLGAEDVAKVDPLLVTYNEKGEVEGVKYDRIGVVLINAVKEQQTQIEELKKQNQLQMQQIEMLMKIVCLQNPNADGCKTVVVPK